MADEKLLPALSLMLPPVCIVCQSPSVAMIDSMASVVALGVVGVVVVVSGTVAVFLNVPQALIKATSMISIMILFFIISFVFNFALQQFVVRVGFQGLGPLFHGLVFLASEPQDIAIMFQQVVVLVEFNGLLHV